MKQHTTCSEFTGCVKTTHNIFWIHSMCQSNICSTIPYATNTLSCIVFNKLHAQHNLHILKCRCSALTNEHQQILVQPVAADMQQINVKQLRPSSEFTACVKPTHMFLNSQHVPKQHVQHDAKRHQHIAAGPALELRWPGIAGHLSWSDGRWH